MKTLTQSLAAAVLAVGLTAGVAVAQGTHSHGHRAGAGGSSMQKSMEDMQPKPTDTPFLKAFKEAHLRMMKDMHFPLSGDPDVDFRKHMIPHHQGAIDMAKVALQYAKDPETKKMAEMIIKAQEQEIAEMQAWLKKNGK